MKSSSSSTTTTTTTTTTTASPSTTTSATRSKSSNLIPNHHLIHRLPPQAHNDLSSSNRQSLSNLSSAQISPSIDNSSSSRSDHSHLNLSNRFFKKIINPPQNSPPSTSKPSSPNQIIHHPLISNSSSTTSDDSSPSSSPSLPSSDDDSSLSPSPSTSVSPAFESLHQIIDHANNLSHPAFSSSSSTSPTVTSASPSALFNKSIISSSTIQTHHHPLPPCSSSPPSPLPPPHQHQQQHQHQHQQHHQHSSISHSSMSNPATTTSTSISASISSPQITIKRHSLSVSPASPSRAHHHQLHPTTSHLLSSHSTPPPTLTISTTLSSPINQLHHSNSSASTLLINSLSPPPQIPQRPSHRHSYSTSFQPIANHFLHPLLTSHHFSGFQSNNLTTLSNSILNAHNSTSNNRITSTINSRNNSAFDPASSSSSTSSNRQLKLSQTIQPHHLHPPRNDPNNHHLHQFSPYHLHHLHSERVPHLSSSNSHSPTPTTPSNTSVTPANTAAQATTNPSSSSSQLEAKVVILGMQGVGKTSIVHRYTTGSFSFSLSSTIGASFCTKKLSVDGCKVRLQIWDTAGQERFRSMAPMYYRGANAAILVYDITNQQSFLDVQNWLDELRQNMTSDLIIQVVGSKADLAYHQRSVDLDEAYQNILKWTSPSSLSSPSVSNSTHQSSSFQFNFIDDESSWNSVGITEVSAKDDVGIEDLFLSLTRRLVSRKVEIDELRTKRSRDSIVIRSNSDPANPLGTRLGRRGPDDQLDRLEGTEASDRSWCC